MVAQGQSTDLLGIGVYTPQEAAFYARVPTQTINRWIWGSTKCDSAFTPEIDGERLVSFRDFVTALAIRTIRSSQQPVSLQKIRSAIQLAEEEYGVSHPLARQHSIYQFGDEIVINLPDHESSHYVQLTGKHKRNRLLKQIVEPFLLNVDYGQDGLASLFRPYSYRAYDIVLDPKLRFGEPLVSSTGYSARTLWEAFRDEGGLGEAARAYGVTEDAVHAACMYYDHLTVAPPN